MEPQLLDAFSSHDFNAVKYVRDLSKQCVGGQELQQQRRNIQSQLEVTNSKLKKNVYRNYTQFIETAKEVSHLETEMYQLGNLLSDQRNLLDGILASSIHSEPLVASKDVANENVKKTEEERRRKLTEIFEKIEGCPNLLESKDRVLLYEGDLHEIDSLENAPLHKAHAYLFSDVFLITTWMPNRRGPVKYKILAMYDLKSLAVVNVRDLGPIKFGFKILTDNDTRLFQCSNANAKKLWMDQLDSAKKQQLTREKQKSQDNPQIEHQKSLLESPTSPSWAESDEKVNVIRHPDWLMDSPEDLDVFIAERHFESALELLMKVKNYFADIQSEDNDSVLLDLRAKTDLRRKHLIDVLIKELEVSPDKSLQGGLRGARRMVKLLNALDRQTQASDLMLQLCTCIMKKQLRSVKREGSPQIYIKQLSHQFYSNLIDVVEEYTRIFTAAGTCLSSLIVWTQQQLQQFVSHVTKQMFVPQATLSVITDCVVILRTQNSQICDCGLDLRYQLDGALYKPITTVLHDTRDKALEAAKHRVSEDKWTPWSLETKENIKLFLEEFNELGLSNIQHFIRDISVEITQNTIAFTKLFTTLLDDCCKMYIPTLHDVIENTLNDVLRGQLTLMHNALKSHTRDFEVQLINKNAQFILQDVIPLAQKKLQQVSGQEFTELSNMSKNFAVFKGDVARPTPKPRQNIPKYTEEYI